MTYQRFGEWGSFTEHNFHTQFIITYIRPCDLCTYIPTSSIYTITGFKDITLQTSIDLGLINCYEAVAMSEVCYNLVTTLKPCHKVVTTLKVQLWA